MCPPDVMIVIHLILNVNFLIFRVSLRKARKVKDFLDEILDFILFYLKVLDQKICSHLGLSLEIADQILSESVIILDI